MCQACFDDYTITDSPAIREAASAVVAVYEMSCVGGGLHVIVDDVNIGDEFFEHEEFWRDCHRSLDEYRSTSDDVTDERIAREQRCYSLLRSLTVDERASAIQQAHRATP